MFLESRVREKDLQSAGSHLEDVRGLPGLLLQQSFTAFTAVITTAEYAYACLKGVSSVRLSVVYFSKLLLAYSLLPRLVSLVECEILPL